MLEAATVRRILSILATCVLLTAAVAPLAAAPQQNSATLYKRLGGYDAIAAVVDDFLGRMTADKQRSRFFGGVSTDSQLRIRQLIVDQVCAATGGPCVYIGRSMKSAHTGLGIADADWNQAVKLLVATLDKFKVPQKEKDELIAVVATLKPDIVTPPAAK
jgi:hemoglobin